MRQYNIIFRVDAAKLPGLSFGHLYRCIALAKQLKNLSNAKISFLMLDYPEAIAIVIKNKFSVLPLNINSPEEQLHKLMSNNKINAHIIIQDLPIGYRTAYQINSKSKMKKAVILDGPQTEYPADIVINSDIISTTKSEENRNGKLYLLGKKYLIIDSNFDGQKKNKVKKNANKILVTFGGSDPARFTEKICHCLNQFRLKNMTINIVIGPGYGDTQSIQELIYSSQNKMHLIRDQHNLCPFILKADIVISAAGRTAYEIAATGTPAILIPTINHEKKTALALRDLSCALYIDPCKKNFKQNIINQTIELVNNHKLRQSLSDSALKIINTSGAYRVAKNILVYLDNGS